jgi:hypothetical protein
MRKLGICALVAAIAALLDFCFVRVYWDSIGISFTRIGQSVAAGLLGEPAFQGGAATAVLGDALHFGIMFAFMLFYVLAAERMRYLRKHPVICAIGYGVAAFVLMNFVVVPLSAAAHPFKIDTWFFASIAAHIAFVGGGAVLAERWLRHR